MWVRWLQRLWRLVWVVLVTLVALLLAAMFLGVALLTLLVLWVRARLTGQPFGWAAWQQAAATRASRTWAQVRTPPGQRPFGGGVDDVVDVSVREVAPQGVPDPAALPRPSLPSGQDVSR